MLYIRELIYEEKTLDDFDVESDNSIFSHFYNALLETPGTRAIDRNAEANITGLFNDACYIFSLARMLKRPHLKLGDFMELCNQDDTYIVMTMVYHLLNSNSLNNDKDLDELAILIKRYLDDNSSYTGCVSMNFGLECNETQELPQPSFFNNFQPRRMTQELLINCQIYWVSILRNCNKGDLKDFVCLWNEPTERNALIDYLIKIVSNPPADMDLPF